MKKTLILLVMGAAAALAQPVVGEGGVLNAASYTLTGLPNQGIAQGSFFVVFGTNLGPAALAQAALPLPGAAGLAGTSVKVTVGGTSVDAFMVYTSAGQIAAILPSNTPAGNGSLTVSYNGQTSKPVSVKIVKTAFGIFTANAAGSGPAIVQNFNSATDQPLNSFLSPAKPGQAAVLLGTGLGPVSGNEAAGPLSGALDVDTQVLVGGKSADVLYKGRSGFIGVDQINFVIPDGVEGCHVPVAVVADGVVSNFASIAIASSGSTCSDPGWLTSTDYQTAKGSGGLKLGAVLLARLAFKVSVFGLSIDSTTDYGTASFSNYTTGGLLASLGQAITAPGTCFAQPVKGSISVQALTDLDPVKGSALDAGPLINVTGSSAKTLPRDAASGLYSATLGGGIPTAGPRTALFLDPGNYTLDNGGGATVGAFRASIAMPAAVNWTNQDSIGSIDRSRDLKITWTGGPADGYVQVLGYSGPDNVAAVFECVERASVGSLTVPAAVLSSLPASVSGSLVPSLLFVGGSANPVRFNAPGLDVGIAQASTLSGKTVNFQ